MSRRARIRRAAAEPYVDHRPRSRRARRAAAQIGRLAWRGLGREQKLAL